VSAGDYDNESHGKQKEKQKKQNKLKLFGETA
jgi:hypothetical protein